MAVRISCVNTSRDTSRDRRVRARESSERTQVRHADGVCFLFLFFYLSCVCFGCRWISLWDIYRILCNSAAKLWFIVFAGDWEFQVVFFWSTGDRRGVRAGAVAPSALRRFFSEFLAMSAFWEGAGFIWSETYGLLFNAYFGVFGYKGISVKLWTKFSNFFTLNFRKFWNESLLLLLLLFRKCNICWKKFWSVFAMKEFQDRFRKISAIFFLDFRKFLNVRIFFGKILLLFFWTCTFLNGMPQEFCK